MKTPLSSLQYNKKADICVKSKSENTPVTISASGLSRGRKYFSNTPSRARGRRQTYQYSPRHLQTSKKQIDLVTHLSWQILRKCINFLSLSFLFSFFSFSFCLLASSASFCLVKISNKYFFFLYAPPPIFHYAFALSFSLILGYMHRYCGILSRQTLLRSSKNRRLQRSIIAHVRNGFGTQTIDNNVLHFCKLQQVRAQGVVTH